MEPTWGPPGSCRPQGSPMSALWTLLCGICRPRHCIAALSFSPAASFTFIVYLIWKYILAIKIYIFIWYKSICFLLFGMWLLNYALTLFAMATVDVASTRDDHIYHPWNWGDNVSTGVYLWFTKCIRTIQLWLTGTTPTIFRRYIGGDV